LILGAVLRIRRNLARRGGPDPLAPVPLPDDLVDEIRELETAGRGTDAIRLIRSRTGLGLTDAVTVSAYVRRETAPH
ncbi:MAG: hypothetical protein AAGC46_18280, partial [Solirubrobacteraceae bacterium]|nr:hypothetical protein [Patulibacter sp.]